MGGCVWIDAVEGAVVEVGVYVGDVRVVVLDFYSEKERSNRGRRCDTAFVADAARIFRLKEVFPCSARGNAAERGEVVSVTVGGC